MRWGALHAGPRRAAARGSSTWCTSIPRSWPTTPECAARAARACLAWPPTTPSSRSTCTTTCRCCRARSAASQRATSPARSAPRCRRSSPPPSRCARCCSNTASRTPIHVLPTGLAADRFRAGRRCRLPRPRPASRPQRPLLTYIGRVAHEKNIGFLVQVFAGACSRSVPEALLVIAGEGPAREALRAQVAALGLHSSVHFAGYLERDTELLDCYAAADAFVFASRTETQGLVLLEAMAQGAPGGLHRGAGHALDPGARERRAGGARGGGGVCRRSSAGAHAMRGCAQGSPRAGAPTRAPGLRRRWRGAWRSSTGGCAPRARARARLTPVRITCTQPPAPATSLPGDSGAAVVVLSYTFWHYQTRVLGAEHGCKAGLDRGRLQVRAPVSRPRAGEVRYRRRQRRERRGGDRLPDQQPPRRDLHGSPDAGHGRPAGGAGRSRTTRAPRPSRS